MGVNAQSGEKWVEWVEDGLDLGGRVGDGWDEGVAISAVSCWVVTSMAEPWGPSTPGEFCGPLTANGSTTATVAASRNNNHVR